MAAIVACWWTIQVRVSAPLKCNRGASDRTLEPLTVLGVLLAAQGLVGSVQYELHLPSDMVWVHVTLATVTWLAMLWAVAAAGSLVPRTVAVPAESAGAPAPELELAGRR
jgi:heme a synthase